MWMKGPVGITLPLKDQKIADFFRKLPRSLSWRALPDHTNRFSEQLHRRMFANYEIKALYCEPTMSWKRI